jgi:hypothetical protein
VQPPEGCARQGKEGVVTLRPPADPEHFRTQVGRFRSRFYVDPLPADSLWQAWDGQVPSVSTVKGAWPKHLVPWATKACAEFAVDHADQWTGLDRQAAVDLIAGASNRTRDKAAARGTGVHHVLEQLAAGQEPMTALIPDVDPYMAACRQLVADLAPTWVATEAVAICRDGWGGTLDAIIHSEILGGTFLVDWKTRTAGKSLGAYDDEGVQMAAYAAADYLIVADGDGNARRVPVPALDGAAIVAIGTDGYKIIPVNLEAATTTWRALRAFWQSKTDGGIMGRPLHTHKAPKAEPVEPVDEMLLRRRAWISARVDANKTAADVADLVAAWPNGVPGPKVGGWDDDQIAVINKALEPLESRLRLSFAPDPANRTEPATFVTPEPVEPTGYSLVLAYRRRIADLGDEPRSWLKDQWRASGCPPLDSDDITEDQLGEFGVLLAAAEARQIAEKVFGDVVDVA